MTDTAVHEWVLMYHPHIRGVADTTLDAYHRSWQTKGWLRIEDTNLDDIPEESLWAMARARGIDLSRAQTKSEIVNIVKEAVTNGR